MTPQAAGTSCVRILERLVPATLPWVSMYWIFAAVILLMLLVLRASRFPEVRRTE